MSDTGATAPAVLVVDDNVAQRAALRAVLEELEVAVVEADSGREALRALLRQAFAVVLLDVNMPGLDGFETAALIRQRPSSEHTPIIFVTAHEDDAYALRGYSMGAVDYILSPVQPNVLRAKVSVFIDLYRNAEEIRAQRRTLERYATQLRQLSEASLAIYSASDFDDVLAVVAENAARIIGARQVGVSAPAPHNGRVTTITIGAATADARASRTMRSTLDHPALRLERPMRLPVAAGDGAGLVPAPVVERRPLRGWLAAPLIARDGRSLGVVQLSDKVDGDFSAEDEDLLLQLARMASTTLDNALAAEAREANRLKDEFLGVLSHELRTPLQAIIAWVHMLRQQSADPKVLAQAADVVERSAQAQMRLIADLLDVSRIARGELRLENETVELSPVVRAALEAARGIAAAKHISLSFVGPSDGRVVGDATRLQQVVWNLLSNAVKFTPEGGRVDVSLAVEPGRLVLRVLDTGPGIPPSFLPYVFERFRQADSSAARSYGGLGLGLAIVRHLVELHHGEVRAENAPGSGALFTVTLPRAGRAAAAATESEPTAPLIGGAAKNPDRLDGIRVLLVEDEVDSRDALSELLQCLGAEVEAVSSAAAALQAVQRRTPDVLVSDVGMPGEDGYSLIQQLRAREGSRSHGLPAVALTAYARVEDRAAALQSGFDAHVHKPVEPIELAHLVKELARRA